MGVERGSVDKKIDYLLGRQKRAQREAENRSFSWELSGGCDQQAWRARLTMLSRRAQGSPTRLFLLTPIDLGRGVMEPKSSILEVDCGLREARGVLPCAEARAAPWCATPMRADSVRLQFSCPALERGFRTV